MSEFHVEYAGDLDGRYSVLGRIVGGQIRVGDRISVVHRHHPQTQFAEYIRPPVVVAHRPTEAVVTHIHAYEVEYTALGPTGRQALVALDTADRYQDGDVLVTSAVSE